MIIRFLNRIFQIRFIQSHLEFLKFAFVGGLNTAVTYFSYVLLVMCRVPWQIASPVGYALGMCNSYFLNKYWTFQNTTAICLRQILKFLLVNFISWGASFVPLWIFIDVLDVNEIIAQIPAMVFSVLVNYLGSRNFVFLNKKRVDR